MVETHGRMMMTRQIAEPMLLYCWTAIADDGPALNQHRVNVSCFLEWTLMIQQARYADTMLVNCWASVADGGPAFN